MILGFDGRYLKRVRLKISKLLSDELKLVVIDMNKTTFRQSTGFYRFEIKFEF